MIQLRQINERKKHMTNNFTKQHFAFLWGLGRVSKTLYRICMTTIVATLVMIYIHVVVYTFGQEHAKAIEFAYIIPMTIAYIVYMIYGAIHCWTGDNKYIARLMTVMWGMTSFLLSIAFFYNQSIETIQWLFDYLLTLGSTLYILKFAIEMGWKWWQYNTLLHPFTVDTWRAYQQLQTIDFEKLGDIFINPDYRDWFFVSGFDDMTHASPDAVYNQRTVTISFDAYGNQYGPEILQYHIPTSYDAPLEQAKLVETIEPAAIEIIEFKQPKRRARCRTYRTGIRVRRKPRR